MDLFKSFFQSERTSGFILILCTLISLMIANLQGSGNFVAFWQQHMDLSVGNLDLDHSIEHWINDGLMTVFFLMIGLEIERELYRGELATLKKAMLPIIAAVGGMLVPAAIHLSLNWGTTTENGFGIPMATDIAFALGILSLAGRNVPISLKIFLTALAIIDDLGAIAIIAMFYSGKIEMLYLAIVILVFIALFLAGKKKMNSLVIYLLGGLVMWYCMMKAGVHPSIAGVLLAFAIPFHSEDDKNLSYKLQKALHYPVAFLILPIFALANTAILLPRGFMDSLFSRNSLGIIMGLLIGKTLGIFLFSYVAVKMKLASLPADLQWKQILGVALLGGIGFTMSMFISNLAFTDPELITSSKISVLFASLFSAVFGLLFLRNIRSR